jgi:hypothetical protein
MPLCHKDYFEPKALEKWSYKRDTALFVLEKRNILIAQSGKNCDR